MWSFQNPVKIIFGPNQFYNLDTIIACRKYTLITYPNSPFNELAQKLEKSAGPPTHIINDVAPNPDYELLRMQTEKSIAACSIPQVFSTLRHIQEKIYYNAAGS